jgi:hypothetical protein
MDIEEICDLLKEANSEYKSFTPNQLAMPSHLLGVASILGEASDKISKLQHKCIKESNDLMKGIYGFGYPINGSNNNNSNKNNNNNNTTRKRKRTNSPKHNNK